MANWKLSDKYATNYPGITTSILDKLSFSEHTITGTDFTGTIDVSSTGVAIATIASLIDVTSIDVTGTITESNGTLNVVFFTAKGVGAGITKKLAANIPLIKTIVNSAWLDMQTTVKSGAKQKPTDVFDIHVDIKLGDKDLLITTQIPMGGGVMMINAQPVGFGIALTDLNVFLNNGESDWQNQFPDTYKQGGAKLELINISLSVNINLDPRKITITAATVTVGIVGFPVIDNKLYLNPLAVWVTVINPTSKPEVSYGLQGDIALLNYENPKLEDPDFDFKFYMALKEFSITGELENPQSKSVNVMLKDLLGGSTSVGLPTELTVNKFDFAASSNTTTGKLEDYSFDIAMSGGFGIFKTIDIEEISISLAHTVAS